MSRLKSAAAVAEASLPSDPRARLNWLQAWRCFAVGLWHYRTGNNQQALRFLNQAMSAPKIEPVVNACCLAVKSMAEQKLGQSADAAADLALAQKLIDEKFSTPLELDSQGLWHDWLSARILLRQAAQR